VDRGDAGTHGTRADDQRPVAADERHQSNLDAGDVSDRVQRAGRALERDAEVARPRLGGLRRRQRGAEGE
jgi:hypothetical protein